MQQPLLCKGESVRRQPASLKFRQLHHVEIEANQIVADTVILQDSIGRLRDVEIGPDGAIYLLNDEDQGALYRLSR